MNNNKIIWEASSYGLINRIISLTATNYEITSDELIIKEGFLDRNTKVIKLADLDKVSLVESLYQRLIKVGTIYVSMKNSKSVVVLKNLKNPEEARQFLTNLLLPKQIENNNINEKTSE